MEITWYGLSCFRLVERGSATVVTDPYDSRSGGGKALKLAADIVTVSHASPGDPFLESIQGTPYVITSPGEYEVGGVFITGIQTGGQKSPEPAKETGQEPKQVSNTLYVFDFDNFTVAHLGDLDRVLTQAEIEAMGTVNVALVPIGLGTGKPAPGAPGRGLNAARAAEVISLLEPNIVIPMCYDAPGSNPSLSGLPLDSLSKFLKEMGLSEVVKQPALKITGSSLPEETQVIVLDHQRG